MRDDPIFAAIKKHRQLEREWMRLSEALERTENKAEKKHGRRPWSLIAWRNYGAIGGQGIDDRREEFLKLPGIDPKKIEKEYRAAKARERAAMRAERAWDKRAGTAEQRRQLEHALARTKAHAIRMAKMKPRTPAGAGALVAYVRTDADTEIEWHMIALDTVAAALASM
jgi:hypothetical protein